MGKSVRLASGTSKVGCSLPDVTDLSHNTGSDRSTAKRSAIGASVTGPRR